MRRIVQIQTTTKCTATCLICPHSSSMLAKQNAVMTDQVFEKIFSRLAEAKIDIPKLPLYMQNEPFTDPHYLARLDFALSHVGQGLVEVSTNLSLLTREISRKLVALGKGRRLTVILSFQGTNRDEFTGMTGMSYDKCLKHARGFLEEAQAGGAKVLIHSFGDEKKITKFWQTKCQLWNLVKWPKIKVISHTNRAGNLAGKYSYDVKKHHVKQCVRHSKWLHFNWKGDMIICCNDYENEVVFGNVMKESIADLVAKIVPTIQRRSKDNPNFICRRCDARCIGQ